MGFSRQEYLPGVGCHALLQRIFSTQGLNPGLPHLLHHRRTLYRRATGEAPSYLLLDPNTPQEAGGERAGDCQVPVAPRTSLWNLKTTLYDMPAPCMQMKKRILGRVTSWMPRS